MEKFLKYEIKVNNEQARANPNYGIFEVGPLESGFGITIGNAMRRVLLSCIPGASVFALSISGAKQEFAAVEGMKEDVTEVVLNFKQLVVKISDLLFEDGEMVEPPLERWPLLTVTAEKAGPVYAKDLECPAGFEVVNKDLYLFSLQTDKKVTVNVYVKQGRGFVTFLENREMINSLGIIATDSNFSPVLHCGYEVQELKTSKQKITDHLTFKIATNGAISAVDAFAMAAKILIEHLNPIVNVNESIKALNIIQEKAEERRVRSFAKQIEELDFTVRTFNCLKRSGIHTLQELLSKSLADIREIRNLGKKSEREIIKKVHELGLKLRS
ncbi:DNA-directed RNA polymerase subunit alpha [Mycoplasmoides pneumoniae]|uniref:DNA-directed RNA polymerase subunit alpha n=3 Tax=Mycoplasmoides pneumoniae TaxID=2104 RepID=A0AAN4XFR9_MYCPM|nr:DNA-directed RNA polymerase subunit alpha [Mycoplasmoides pneumoniae]ADK86748.1 DNA-directed RNA polymerase, alpha subunit [Mycoplasmoides pneumoniae FH]AGC04118.1 DNA-directed RNA polymerase subunit alpha [Mycoplasmoides pneumoniae M129-B7]ALA30075.1 DNA-directed RNA polymerase subunit alpha [Mycoplasmoides pneumoniae PI 1428]ALA31033.1 DNA-directed RNA polymerase subunit alpha [Mycoplasmoides pneumoniae 19294]ALA31473.1 DNA-directed RNA polymerase subunit alpha [Mycoplasmoides pneumoniae 